jgi:hypothetical protein
MPPPELPVEFIEEVARLYNEGQNQIQISDKYNKSRSTAQHWLKIASRRGLIKRPVYPGYVISKVTTLADGKQVIQQKPEPGAPFEVPAGHAVKGVSALIDADGNTVQQWIKTKEGVLDPLAVAEKLKATFEDYQPAALPIPAPTTQDDLLTLIPCNDFHVGMYAWGQETGVDWDLKIAERTIGRAVEDVIARSMPSGQCIVLGGGDLLHADNKRNETTGGTPQDVDGRYEKTIEVATRLMVRIIDACLRKHGHITVRILKGNHDEHASVAVVFFLKAYYRNEPRVKVDTDPSIFFWFRFGQVLLGATHGHLAKAKDMPSIMAHRQAKHWGETKYRFVHCFHVHHRERLATEGQGVITEIHQAPIPQDSWHFGSGFLSGRSIQAITYHKRLGWYGGAVETIQDAEIAA